MNRLQQNDHNKAATVNPLMIHPVAKLPSIWPELDDALFTIQRRLRADRSLYCLTPTVYKRFVANRIRNCRQPAIPFKQKSSQTGSKPAAVSTGGKTAAVCAAKPSPALSANATTTATTATSASSSVTTTLGRGSTLRHRRPVHSTLNAAPPNDTLFHSIVEESKKNEKKLYVSTTTLPLPAQCNGLFTEEERKPLDWLGEYRGEHLTPMEVDERYGDEVAPYACSVNFSADEDPQKTITIDAADPAVSSIARFANDVLPETKQYMTALGLNKVRHCQINASFVPIAPNRVFLRCIRHIPARGEVFASYTSTIGTAAAPITYVEPGTLEYWGTPVDRTRTAILEHLAQSPMGVGLTACAITAAIVEHIQLAFGDPFIKWERMQEIVQQVLLSEISKPVDKSSIIQTKMSSHYVSLA